jgi:histidine kinase/DNA gyrase B/HSP90-like ATPase
MAETSDKVQPLSSTELFKQSHFSFGQKFMEDHAGHIINDPRVAIIELIANAYDAGASEVRVEWPTRQGEILSVADNGTGMTLEEFEHRWTTLCYNRIVEQGENVVFPEPTDSHRVAFGRSGKGRHAAFCFADSYSVVTFKQGQALKATVRMVGGGDKPFEFSIERTTTALEHGTLVSANAERNLYVNEEEIQELIGSKFLVDPSFNIFVNNRPITLFDLKSVETKTLDIGQYGKIHVHEIDSDLQDRKIKLKGIAWWVNSRMVGTPSWEGLDGEGAYLDGRSNLAKRYSFVVKADILKDDVRPDWTGFDSTNRVEEVRQIVHKHVVRSLNGLQAGTRKERKKAALDHSREILGGLPRIARRTVEKFVDEVQEKCPSLSDKDLARTVEVLGKLEQAKSSYDLLKQLQECSPDDLDKWNDLMQRWTATNAEIVLDELDRRLALIGQLQGLVDKANVDELHELQPLFERGLWMFGVEYEAIDFRSNRSLVTIVRDLLGGTDQQMAPIRPDLVGLPDSSIGIYTANSFADDGEIEGLRKVLVVELKRGGFKLTYDEVDQARKYAIELQKAHDITPSTEIVAFVLGASADSMLQRTKIGDNIVIVPMLYRTLLARAHSRTFNLQQRLEASNAKS